MPLTHVTKAPLHLGNVPVLAARLYNLFAATPQLKFTMKLAGGGADKHLKLKKSLPGSFTPVLVEGQWNIRYLSEYFEERGSAGLASLLVISLFLGQAKIEDLMVSKNKFIYCGDNFQAFCGFGQQSKRGSFALTARDLTSLPVVKDYKVAGWLDNKTDSRLEDYVELSHDKKFLTEKYLTILKIVMVPEQVLQIIMSRFLLADALLGGDTTHLETLTKLLLERQQLLKQEALKLPGFIDFVTQEVNSRNFIADFIRKLTICIPLPYFGSQQELTGKLTHTLSRLSYQCLSKKLLFGKDTRTIQQNLQNRLADIETESEAIALVELLADTSHTAVRSDAKDKLQNIQFRNAGMFASDLRAVKDKKPKLASIEMDEVSSFHRRYPAA